MNMVHIFWVITVEFLSNDRYICKIVSSILHFVGIFSLAAVRIFKMFQYLFVFIILIQSQKKFQIHLPSLKLFFKIAFLHYFPQNFKNMDVASIDTSVNVDNKIVNTETHHTHDQARKHQQKRKTVFPTSIMQLLDCSIVIVII